MKKSPLAMIVDDEEEWRNALAGAMSTLGCEVRRYEGAQEAYDALRGSDAWDILVLDWDLQGKTRGLPTVVSEDVFRKAILGSPEIVVIIVSGALDNAEYLEQLKLRGSSPQEQAERIVDLHPARLFAKGKLIQELSSGLPTFVEILKAEGIMKRVLGRLSAPRQLLFDAKKPFQLDCNDARLLDSNGRSIRLTLPQHTVLLEMMTSQSRRISDAEIAKCYPNKYEALKKRIARELESAKTEEQKEIVSKRGQDAIKQIAMEFRGKLRDRLKRYGIEKDLLIDREEGYGYVEAGGWHLKPLLNAPPRSVKEIGFNDGINYGEGPARGRRRPPSD